MTESASPTPVPTRDARPAAPPAAVWHLCFAAASTAAGAALLAVLGGISWRIVGGLGLGVVAGLAGYLWRPAPRQRLALLGLWTACAAGAATFQGGLTGPLGLWCAMPLFAGAVLGAVAEGAVLSAACLAVLVLLELAGAVQPAATGAFGVGLAAAGLLTSGGAAVAAFAILDRQARAAVVPKASEAPAPSQAVEPTVAAAWSEERAALETRLGEAAAEAAALEARVVALGRKLRITELARNRAFRLVARAGAAGPEQPALEAERVQTRDRLLQAERRLAAAETARDQLHRALATAEDARARAEAAQADAEAQAVGKSRFLANMSHELRTPLNAIMGFSDIMRNRLFGELPPKYAEYGELIHEAGRHLTDLINDVLDMSKIEAERYTLVRERFDAREAVNAALRLMRLQADEAGIQLRGVLPSAPLPVDADRRALKQMVLNLVSNALKFTPKSGSVMVTVKAADGAFELVVADTGVGIAREDLVRLGRPFEQAGDAEYKAQGTGLGLSLVKALAGLHGGEMSIESELGEGATVTVRLPVLTAAPAAQQPEPAPERGRGGVVIPLNLAR